MSTFTENFDGVKGDFDKAAEALAVLGMPEGHSRDLDDVKRALVASLINLASLSGSGHVGAEMLRSLDLNEKSIADFLKQAVWYLGDVETVNNDGKNYLMQNLACVLDVDRTAVRRWFVPTDTKGVSSFVTAQKIIEAGLDPEDCEKYPDPELPLFKMPFVDSGLQFFMRGNAKDEAYSSLTSPDKEARPGQGKFVDANSVVERVERSPKLEQRVFGELIQEVLS